MSVFFTLSTEVAVFHFFDPPGQGCFGVEACVSFYSFPVRCVCHVFVSVKFLCSVLHPLITIYRLGDAMSNKKSPINEFSLRELVKPILLNFRKTNLEGGSCFGKNPDAVC